MDLFYRLFVVPMATYSALGVIAVGSLQLIGVAMGAPSRRDADALGLWLDRHPVYMATSSILGFVFMPVLLAMEALIRR